MTTPDQTPSTSPVSADTEPTPAEGEQAAFAGGEEQIALEIEKLLEADGIEGCRRGNVIFLLPHGCGRM